MNDDFEYLDQSNKKFLNKIVGNQKKNDSMFFCSKCPACYPSEYPICPSCGTKQIDSENITTEANS